MKVIRPHEAEDNDTNKGMREVLERYLKKIGSEAETIEIYGLSVVIKTTDGREFQMNMADGCRFGTTYNQKHFWYMVERVDGKRKRIKKQDWI